jgi:hypothetical protein
MTMSQLGGLLSSFISGLPAAVSALVVAMAGVIAPAGAGAQELRWNNEEIDGKEFDCLATGSREIVISGIVKLVRQDDRDLLQEPRLIKVSCGLIRFEPGAELRTDSELLVIADVLAGEKIVFRSTRGIKGGNAPPTPQIWGIIEAGPGTDGRDGRPSGEKNDGALGACRDGKNGGQGERGDVGYNGIHGQPGASGLSGVRGARVTILVGRFETGKEVMQIYSLGGDGGRGGKGGRGEDGGMGGNGGRGGNGGNSECFHAGAHGGRGGDGGNGGRGGNGGAGGNGGDGGSGGAVTFGIGKDQTRPAEYAFFTEGGLGGEPGLGGDRGEGGDPGQGGGGGDGGDGLFKDGSSGNRGNPGEKGLDGIRGPLGNFGVDGGPGPSGGSGTWSSGEIVPEILSRAREIPVY